MFNSRREHYEQAIIKAGNYFPEAKMCLEDVIAAEEEIKRLSKELREAEIKAEASRELYLEAKELAKYQTRNVIKLQTELHATLPQGQGLQRDEERS